MLQDTPRYGGMLRGYSGDAPGKLRVCSTMLQGCSRYAPVSSTVAPSCSRMLRAAPQCYTLIPVAARCSMLIQAAPACTRMLHDIPGYSLLLPDVPCCSRILWDSSCDAPGMLPGCSRDAPGMLPVCSWNAPESSGVLQGTPRTPRSSMKLHDVP